MAQLLRREGRNFVAVSKDGATAVSIDSLVHAGTEVVRVDLNGTIRKDETALGICERAKADYVLVSDDCIITSFPRRFGLYGLILSAMNENEEKMKAAHYVATLYNKK